MLSRLAETIFWTNRYLERADNNARYVNVNFNLSLDLSSEGYDQWNPLIQTTGSQKLFKSLYDEVNKKNVIRFLGFDLENPSSIYSCVYAVRENSRGMRENISAEMWEEINELYFLLKEGYQKKVWNRKDPSDFFGSVIKYCQTIYGMIDTGVVRTEGWHFSRLGKFIERADNTSRILDVKYHIILPSKKDIGTTVDLIQWAALLKSVGSYNAYRQKYGLLNPNHIVDHLLLNKDLPRSTLFCIDRAYRSVSLLSGATPTPAQKAIKDLRNQLLRTNAYEIIEFGLHEYVDHLQEKLIDISNTLSKQYFVSKKN